MTSSVLQSLHAFCPTEAVLLSWANKIAYQLQPGTVLFLQGQLGAGKTTLVRGMLQSLGLTDKVKSPTYTLVEGYEIDDKIIFHFDLYRLTASDELYFIGLPEYFTSTSICLIEWPEKGFPLLPVPDLICHINIIDEGRELCLDAMTDLGKNILLPLSLI